MNGPDFQYDGLTAFAPITSAATDKKKGLMSAADYTLLHSLQVPNQRLLYTAASDLYNGTLPANTWTTIVPNQTFTASSASSLFLFVVNVGLSANLPASATEMAMRVSYDDSTSVIDKLDATTVAASGYTGLRGGVALRGGFAAGSHTIKVQVISSVALNLACRALSVPNFEWAVLRAWEMNP